MGTVCTVAEGQITPSEGEAFSKVLLAQQAVLVKADLEARVNEIERRLAVGKLFSPLGKPNSTPEKPLSVPEGNTRVWESVLRCKDIYDKPAEAPVEKINLNDPLF